MLGMGVLLFVVSLTVGMAVLLLLPSLSLLVVGANVAMVETTGAGEMVGSWPLGLKIESNMW
jgi:hypothetical protein